MSAPDPLNGTLLGKDYRVIEPIGRGGMAIVYLVEHQTLKKRFAAKVLAAELSANEEARARFNQEAHAASQLDHENIVNISDFGVTSDERPYFVMELLRGETLDARLSAGPMSIEEVIAVTVPVCRALAFAHAEGIVHRDVKPENVFLVQRTQGRWTVKVVDFGIAKTPLNGKLTKMGETLGSPYYMAPEACRGDAVDHRADIYSFGCLLYLMLCGRLPFEDESLLKVLQLQISAPIPPPRSVNPKLTPELAEVIEGCLAKNPDDRYPSMESLLVDLEAAIPPGADRLLIEVQTRNTAAFRTPFPLSSTGSMPRAASSSGKHSALAGTAQPNPVVATPSQVAAPTAVTPSAVVAPQPSNRKAAYLAAAIGVVFAAIGLTVALRNRTETSNGSNAPSTPPVTATAQAAPPATPIGSTNITKPRELGPAARSTVKVVVRTRPEGARVTLGGVELGTTPVSTSVDRVTDSRSLIVSLDGYRSVDTSVTPIENIELELELERVADKVVTQKPTQRNANKRNDTNSGRSGNTPPSEQQPKPPPKGPTLDIRMSR